MTIILGDGAAVLMVDDMATCDQLYRESALSRFRESRRRRKHNQRLSAAHNPLVFQPRAPRLAPQPPPAPSARKELRNSDVSIAGRIVLPKKFAEMYLPSLSDKEGFWMHMDDMDCRQVWTLKFSAMEYHQQGQDLMGGVQITKFWPNHRSRMYIFENAREFIKRHSLELGDYVMVFKDDQAGSYLLRGRKKDDSSAIPTIMNNSSNTSFPSSLEEYCNSTLYRAENDQYDYHDEATPDYQQLVRTPCCESLDLSSLNE